MNALQEPRPEAARTEITRAFVRRQWKTALAMVVAGILSVILFKGLPSPLDGVALGFGGALVMTVFLVGDSKSLRTRGGSLGPAILLVAFLWIAAFVVGVLSLLDRF